MTCQAATVGAVAAAVVAMPSILGTGKLWCYLYLIDLLSLLPVLLLLSCMPESPGKVLQFLISLIAVGSDVEQWLLVVILGNLSHA